jgi:hypothetical protein
MNPSSFAFSKKIQIPMSSSPKQMLDMVGYLVRRLYPNLRSTEKLGVPNGFIRDKSSGLGEFWFQCCYCGTWEEPLENYSQLKEILERTSVLATLDYQTESFYLVLSTRFGNGELKNWLLEELQKMLGKWANEVEVFDRDDFVRFIFEQVGGEIRDRALEANHRFTEEYRERMEQIFYLPDVPFITKSAAVRSMPIPFLDNLLKIDFAELSEFIYSLREQGRYTASQPTRDKVFLVSEFGFGKTSLLLRYAEHLRGRNILSIFIPMALLSPMVFSRTDLFSKAILELILLEKLDEQNLFDGLRIRAFKEMLKFRTDIVLLFDGLDEHQLPYHAEGLNQIKECLKDFKPPCVFSVRKEFWDARRERFEETFMTRHRRIFEKIELVEWPDEVILSFIKEYGERTGTTSELKEFFQLVNEHRYEEFYGDIPKRPLFLEMLIRDVSSGELRTSNRIQKRNLAQLYEDYFREKFRLGRASFFSSQTARPLPMNNGTEKVIENMLMVMERSAAAMLSNDELGSIEFLNQIPVSKIENFLQQAGFADDLSFFLHSVLIPFGKHDLTGLKVKFAHKSFQEYFVARYLTKILLNPNLANRRDLDWFNRYKISDGVPLFILGYLENFDTNERKVCLQSLQNFETKNSPSESLVKRLIKELKS